MMARRRRSVRMSRPLKSILIIGLVLAASDFLLYAWYCRAVERQLEGVNPSEADCAIVLFEDFAQGWALNEETIRRCRHTLHLYLKARVSAIICSGGNRPKEGKSGAKAMFQWFLEHGVPRHALHLENDSCDTLGNIRNSTRLAAALGYSSALFVSSPLHLYRVEFLLRGKTASEGITVHLAPYSYQGISPKPRGLSLFKQAHYEWISLGLYLLLPKSLYNRIILYTRGCKADMSTSLRTDKPNRSCQPNTCHAKPALMPVVLCIT
jgi:uncharacterized SAM-binding protein YcdF (DUF218 family)